MSPARTVKPSKALTDVTCALVALAKVMPGTHTVDVYISSGGPQVRFSCNTQEDFASLAAAFGAKVSTVDFGKSEWEIGTTRIDDHINVEVSGPHRPKVTKSAEPAVVDAEAAKEAITQAEAAWSGMSPP